MTKDLKSDHTQYTVRVFNDGFRIWYQNGQLHREDGPAIENASGYNHWYINGKRHREDGPAIVCPDGTKHWFLNGEEYTEDEFNTTIPIKEYTKDDLEKLLGHPFKIMKEAK